MAYNLAGLPTFIQQQDEQIKFLSKALLEAKTSKLVRKVPGILGPVSVPIFNTDVQIQPFACNTNGQLYQGSGSLTITQVTITPAALMLGQTVCAQDLQKYFAEYLLKPTEYQDSIPFEEEFLGYYASALAVEDEKIAWNGNTTSTNNNLSQVNGFLVAISASLGNGLGTTGYASGSVHYSASSGSPITSSNVVAILDGIYQSIPLTVRDKEDAFIAVGNDVFDTYVLALRNQNLFNFPPNAKDRVIEVPGFTVKIYGVNGLNAGWNTNYSIVAGRWSNFIKVIAADSDMASIKADYNAFTEQVQLKTKFLIGYGVGIASEVVWAYNGQ